MRVAVEGLGATLGPTDGAGRYLMGILGALARRDDVEPLAFVGPSMFESVSSIGIETQLVGGASRGSRILAQHVAVPRAAAKSGVMAVVYTGNYAPVWRGPAAVTVVQNLLLAQGTTEYGVARAIYRRWARAWIARRADAVVAISRFLATELERTEPSLRGRVTVAYPGVDPELFEAADEERAPEAAPYFLGVGTVWAYRDYALSLHALAASGLPHEFVIAGGVSPAERTRLEDEAQRLGLRERLRLIGAVEPAELSQLYAGATALVAVSRLEAFSFPAVEAMAAGTPVVAARRGVYPEVIADAGILADAYPEAIAAALSRVTDATVRERLRAAGTRRARELNWDACAAGLLNACRAALK